MVVRRFTTHEYERMAREGILRPDERVELLDGEIVVMTPQGTRHATVLRLVTCALEEAFAAGHDVRSQLPMVIDPDGEPEPDVAVVTGKPDDYLHEHPRTAVLVVEVSETTLAVDRRKASIYARANVGEYWIVNLVDRVLETYRSPEQTSEGSWSYSEMKRLKPTATVQPLAAPKTKLKVSSFLR
jgi:Uma2 family endonuclease